jgi:hypothetical protein
MRRAIKVNKRNGACDEYEISKFVVCKSNKIGFHIEPLKDGTVRLVIGDLFDDASGIDCIEIIREN